MIRISIPHQAMISIPYQAMNRISIPHQAMNRIRKGLKINKNLYTAINWLNDETDKCEHLIERVCRLSCHILKVLNRLRPSKCECGDSIEATIENLFTIQNLVNTNRYKCSMETVYVLTHHILELIGLRLSSVKCGNLVTLD